MSSSNTKFAEDFLPFDIEGRDVTFMSPDEFLEAALKLVNIVDAQQHGIGWSVQRIINDTKATTRHGKLGSDVIDDFAEAMRNGRKFPPVLLNPDKMLWDGFHRVLAAKSIGLDRIPVIREKE